MLDKKLITAVIQICSVPDLEKNLSSAAVLVAEAAHAGARFITLPENTPFLGGGEQNRAYATSVDGSIVQHFQSLAKKHRAWILLGSFPEKSPDLEKVFNTSVLIDSKGEVQSVYRKIHLFDVKTPKGDVLHESASTQAGDELVVVDAGHWKIGLSVCYDLRFPEMYRELVRRGANLLCIPAAFTAETGRDHWQMLLRARAVENLSFVVAPNQFGHHCKGRRSYGRSAIIDPWGNILATCPDRPSIALSTLDLDELLRLREGFPCLMHRRDDLF